MCISVGFFLIDTYMVTNSPRRVGPTVETVTSHTGHTQYSVPPRTFPPFPGWYYTYRGHTITRHST